MVTRPRALSLRTLLRDELGASLVEYALIISLVAIACVFSMRLLGTDTKQNLNGSVTAITGATAAQNPGGGNGEGDGHGNGHGNGNGGENRGR